MRHESNKSLAIRKRRFFRPTAQGSSFFNPSETRRVLTWLQSVFGARDRPGSLTACRRTTDGIPLHNEHISGTHNSILLSRSHKWSSRGYEKRAYRESFTPCSGEWPSANHSNYGTVPGQSKRFFPRADCDDALKLEQLLQRRLVRNRFISDGHDASVHLHLVQFAELDGVLRNRYCIE